MNNHLTPADPIFGEREPSKMVQAKLQRRGIDPSILRAGFRQGCNKWGTPYLTRCWVLVDEAGSPTRSIRFNRAGSMTIDAARWANLSVEKP